MATELTMRRGDTKQWIVTVTDVAGAPAPITGTMFFTARRHHGDVPVVEKVTGDGIDTDGLGAGQARLTLEPADTAGLPSVNTRLLCDLQLVEGAVVTTLLPDPETADDFTLIVRPDVTTRVTP
jgi:hypothetical protein